MRGAYSLFYLLLTKHDINLTGNGAAAMDMAAPATDMVAATMDTAAAAQDTAVPEVT